MKVSFHHALICIVLSCSIAGFGFSEEVVHVIQKGDTIYSIARSYGLSADEVLTYNKINDPSKVSVGTKIRIPGTGEKETIAPAGSLQMNNEYRVEKNDTLYSISRRYGISVADLLAMNGFSSSYVLKAGEKIRVPGSANTDTAVAAIKIDSSVKWPIKAKEIARITGKLNGVQLTGDRQESVKSLTGGIIVSAGPYRGFGRVAIVQTTAGYLYVYGGCETLSVNEGDKVAAGSELGKLGIDTKTAKSQLFFFVYKGNTPVDPAKAPRA